VRIWTTRRRSSGRAWKDRSRAPVVIDCIGEDFYLSIDALVLEHVVVHPGGELFGPGSLTSAVAEVHGSGYGLTPGTNRPQTNGKAERLIRTLLERWAYAYSYANEAERAAALPDALDSYNPYRPHRALAGQTPLQRVNDLSGTNS
jgi:hypothetical protein